MHLHVVIKVSASFNSFTFGFHRGVVEVVVGWEGFWVPAATAQFFEVFVAEVGRIERVGRQLPAFEVGLGGGPGLVTYRH